MKKINKDNVKIQIIYQIRNKQIVINHEFPENVFEILDIERGVNAIMDGAIYKLKKALKEKNYAKI